MPVIRPDAAASAAQKGRAIRHACATALLLASAACHRDPPFGPNSGQVVPFDSLRGARMTLRVLQGGAPATAPILTVVPRLYDIVLTDSTGRRVTGATIAFRHATGFIRADSAGEAGWRSVRDAILTTGADGHIRFRWHTGAEPAQRLALEHGVFRSTTTTTDTIATLQGTGSVMPVTAEKVAPSGVTSTCVLQAGRVGCLGAVAREAEGSWGISPSIAVQAPRWLQTPSPVVTIRSVLEGACALLVSGATTCWQGLGPDGPLPVSTGHPPFVELAGRYARAADASVWALSWQGTRDAPTWVAIQSDSVIARLLVSGTGIGGCGLTAGGTVLCGARDGIVGSTPDSRMVVLRASSGGRGITATTGYAKEAFYWADGGGFRQMTVVVDSAAAAARQFTVLFRTPVPAISALGWETQRTSRAEDVPVSGDGSTRTCVRLLSGECSADVWSSIATFGVLEEPIRSSSRTLVVPIYYRKCGIRGVIVCHSAARAYIGQRDTLVVPAR